MKTIEIRKFYRTLSELNNSFTHYSLVWYQFNIDYFTKIKNDPDIMTMDYFDSNPFRRKHNIRLKDLEKEHEKTNKTLLEGIFLLIYSHYESYLKEILDFSRNVDDKIKQFEEKIEGYENDSTLLDKVFNRLAINRKGVEPDLFDTLDYLRLKRNRLTHQNSESISKSLRKLIDTKGEKLNLYWDKNLPSKRQEIDFVTKENADELNFNIIIDTINIFRRITKDIDKCIIEKLTEMKIIEKFILPEFLIIQNKNKNKVQIDRLISKFRRYCSTKYSLTIDNEMIELLKSSIA